MEYVDAGGLTVARVLFDFVNNEAIAGTGLNPSAFWQGLGGLVRTLAPRNVALLRERDALQQQIDAWHRNNRGKPVEQAACQEFLREISYLKPEPPEFAIGTANVDPEIAMIAGPQLVVPVTNARYALNAANARWGSLYDALYGTDMIEGPRRAGGYDAERGARVIGFVRDFLDDHFTLSDGSYHQATGFHISA